MNATKILAAMLWPATPRRLRASKSCVPGRTGPEHRFGRVDFYTDNQVMRQAVPSATNPSSNR